MAASIAQAEQDEGRNKEEKESGVDLLSPKRVQNDYNLLPRTWLYQTAEEVEKQFQQLLICMY